MLRCPLHRRRWQMGRALIVQGALPGYILLGAPPAGALQAAEIAGVVQAGC